MRRPAVRTMAPIDLDPKPRRYPVVPALHGDAITHLPSGLTGRVERFANRDVQIRDQRGDIHTLRIVPGAFSINGIVCEPVVGRATKPTTQTISASGSISVDHRARVARASRIFVEGVHDAELVEKVWGDDLRYEGIVVERLDGMDDLAAVVADFGPTPDKRMGILLDHLVDGSKESRAAAQVDDPNVLITGTPFVDVWQAVRPHVAGIDEWPDVPMGEEWKAGILRRIGLAAMAPGEYWKLLLSRIRTYADVLPPLVGAVEQLIDFVTAEPS